MTNQKIMPPFDLLHEYIDYNPNTGIGTWKKQISRNLQIGKEVGSITPNNYRSLHFFGQRYMAHRVFWFMHYGEDPFLKQIDHIDRNSLNNKIENLRLVEAWQNHHNKNQTLTNQTKSNVTGVNFHKNKNIWIANLSVNKKRYYLGCFKNIEDAIKARKEAEIKYLSNIYNNSFK
jgi:hypothetical protein